MLKFKVLVMLALYIILAVIAFFNFGLYHLTAEKAEWKRIVNDAAKKNFDEDIEDILSEVTQESQSSPSDKETN
jgi:hypothetical protein